jgi:glycosyltransferase involved in cell wall biosynthesis
MAWGKPVIGCNIGGIPEIIHEGENGFLIPPHDHEALAQRIIDLQNHSLRVKMGQTGRKMVEEKFSMSRCIDETLKIYYKVCSNHQAG